MSKHGTNQYNFPTSILSGKGAIKDLNPSLGLLGISKPLIVTDEGLSRLPVFKTLLKRLEKGQVKYAVYSDFSGNPVKNHVENGARSYKFESCDGILTIGGGAAMDVAKAIAVLVNHPEDLFAYEDIPGAKTIDGEVPKIIAVPTTAGTGSEVGRSAVISEDESHRKRIIFSPKLLPQRVLIDPELTIKLPSHITAATGMDALTHLVEAYLAKGYHPQAEAIAIRGISMVSNSLIKSYKFAKTRKGNTAEHLTARHEMLDASMMGAVAFQKGLGVNHSCAHALSTVCDLHHGLANAIMLPHCMKFNSVGNAKAFRDLSEAAGLKNKNAAGFISWIKSLNKTMGIPADLKSVGVEKSQIKALVNVAIKDVCHPSNPRKVTKKDFELLFKKAIG